jgi:nitrite reductase/ring-hydroxylating ferredoxin subunit
MRRLNVCALAAFPPGSARAVRDGPLAEGELDADTGVAVCPRHGAGVDIRSGRPLTLPAVLPVRTFPVAIEVGRVVVELKA